MFKSVKVGNRGNRKLREQFVCCNSSDVGDALCKLAEVLRAEKQEGISFAFEVLSLNAWKDAVAVNSVAE